MRGGDHGGVSRSADTSVLLRGYPPGTPREPSRGEVGAPRSRAPHFDLDDLSWSVVAPSGPALTAELRESGTLTGSGALGARARALDLIVLPGSRRSGVYVTR